jgi:hypothetical protein
MKPIRLLKTFRFLIGFSVILCVHTSSSAQSQNYAEWENGVTERWWVDLAEFPKQELDNAIEQWRRIGVDNQNAKSHEWAGGYFTGSNTHGTYLRWSQQSGFILAQVDKCAATLMGLSYGKVVTSPTSVEFIFEYHKSSGSHGHTKSHTPAPTAIKFITIKWSNDQYLVQENEMTEFGNYVAGLGKYNQEYAWLDGTDYFARSISEAKSNYDELPQVPSEYVRFIKKPIDAEITAVGAPGLRRLRDYDGPLQYEGYTPVTMNVGSLNGVKKGMLFRVLSSDQGESVKIVRVGKYSSEGVIVRWLDENKQEYERYPPIKVGWRLSTSAHKYFSGEGS